MPAMGNGILANKSYLKDLQINHWMCLLGQLMMRKLKQTGLVNITHHDKFVRRIFNNLWSGVFYVVGD